MIDVVVGKSQRSDSSAPDSELSEALSVIGHRHGFSPEAASVMWEQLIRSNDGTVEFDHTELGGYGRWRRGLTVLGDSCSYLHKARVDDLCNDLSQFLELITASPRRSKTWSCDCANLVAAPRIASASTDTVRALEQDLVNPIP